MFLIAQLWLTSHPRSTVVLLDSGTPGASREIFSEDADGETRTPSSYFLFFLNSLILSSVTLKFSFKKLSIFQKRQHVSHESYKGVTKKNK